MEHKSTKKSENDITKSFCLKAVCDDEEVKKFKLATNEFGEYYSRLSKFICENLTIMTVGDVANYTPESKRGSGYYTSIFENSEQNLPLYKFIKDKGDNANNLIYNMVVNLNPENYSGNIFSISENNYRKYGYFSNVISNIRTRLSTLKSGIKKKAFDPNDVDETTLIEQTIFELEKIDNFDNEIEYWTRKGKDKIVERLVRLKEYYNENKDVVNDYRDRLVIEQLKGFQCKRQNFNSMSIIDKRLLVENAGLTSYRLKFISNRKPYFIELLGHKQLVKLENGKRVDLIDLCNKVGISIIFEIKKDKKTKKDCLFVCLSVPVEFSKTPLTQKNCVGIDTNIKHSLLSCDKDVPTDLKGYVNLYGELLNDPEFISTLNQTELEYYTALSNNVHIGFIEYEGLFERYLNQLNNGTNNNRFLKRELAIMRVFDNIRNTTDDIRIKNYINYNKKFRSALKAYFLMKETYNSKLSEYDKAHSTQETLSKDEKKELTERFNRTETGIEILEKLNNIRQDVIGCRDNIINYAFNLFLENGYDTISLEYLDNSQFEKTRMTSPKSLLKYHKLEGKTKDEVESYVSACRGVSKSHYVFKYDDDGKLISVEFSKTGETALAKTRFINLIPKAIQWASIKDKFVELANNKPMNIGWVPAPYTSQVDSTTNSMYCTKENKEDKKTGKNKIVDVITPVEYIRESQEKHRNGMNADTNSATNIKYLLTDEKLREVFMKRNKEGKNMYNKPLFEIKDKFKKNGKVTVFNELSKHLNKIYGTIENGKFIEQEI